MLIVLSCVLGTKTVQYIIVKHIYILKKLRFLCHHRLVAAPSLATENILALPLMADE